MLLLLIIYFTRFLNLHFELLSGIEPPTSSLPRRCSTTELQQPVIIACCLLYLKELYSCIHEKSLSLGTFKRIKTAYASPFCLLSVYTVIHQLQFPTLLKSERRVSNPQPPAWKAGALPIELLSLNLLTMRQPSFNVGTGGFEPPKSKQQIYSLSHLATLVYPHFKLRAEEGTRTPDLLITNQWLYQLSYFGLIFLLLKNVPFNWGCKFNNNFCCCKKIYNFFRLFSKINIFSLRGSTKKEGKSLPFRPENLTFSASLSSLQRLCDQPSCHLFLYSSLQDKPHLFLQKTVKRPPCVKLHLHCVLMANH